MAPLDLLCRLRCTRPVGKPAIRKAPRGAHGRGVQKDFLLGFFSMYWSHFVCLLLLAPLWSSDFSAWFCLFFFYSSSSLTAWLSRLRAFVVHRALRVASPLLGFFFRTLHIERCLIPWAHFQDDREVMKHVLVCNPQQSLAYVMCLRSVVRKFR